MTSFQALNIILNSIEYQLIQNYILGFFTFLSKSMFELRRLTFQNFISTNLGYKYNRISKFNSKSVEISKNFKHTKQKKMKLILALACLAVAFMKINSAPLLEQILATKTEEIATTPTPTTEPAIPDDKGDANNKKKRQYYNSMFITTNRYDPHTHSTPAMNYNNMNIYNPNDVNQFVLEHSNQGYNTLFPNPGMLTTATKDPFSFDFLPSRFPSGQIPQNAQNGYNNGQNAQNGYNNGQNAQNGYNNGQYGYNNGQNGQNSQNSYLSFNQNQPNQPNNQNQYNQYNQNPLGYQSGPYYSTPSPFNNQYNQNQQFNNNNNNNNNNYNNQYQYPTTTQRTLPVITVGNVEDTYSKSFNPYYGMPDPRENFIHMLPTRSIVEILPSAY